MAARSKETHARAEVGQDHVPQERRLADAAFPGDEHVAHAGRGVELNRGALISFQCAEEDFQNGGG